MTITERPRSSVFGVGQQRDEAVIQEELIAALLDFGGIANGVRPYLWCAEPKLA